MLVSQRAAGTLHHVLCSRTQTAEQAIEFARGVAIIPPLARILVPIPYRSGFGADNAEILPKFLAVYPTRKVDSPRFERYNRPVVVRLNLHGCGRLVGTPVPQVEAAAVARHGKLASCWQRT